MMLKLDFQRAVLQRIPKIAADPERTWRDLLFVCDEYHAFATVGETDPTGDERTFALSRQARLIPIVATQSISSLRSALPGDEAGARCCSAFARSCSWRRATSSPPEPPRICADAATGSRRATPWRRAGRTRTSRC